MHVPAVIAPALMAFAAWPAMAGEIEPDFLSGGKTYATNTDYCFSSPGGTGVSDVVFYLDRRGVSGYEFGCQFLSILDARLDPALETESVLAIAACGDDSGINRGNSFHISSYPDGVLSVTSQNDYLLTFLPGYEEALDSQEDESEDWYLIEREFRLCEQ